MLVTFVLTCAMIKCVDRIETAVFVFVEGRKLQNPEKNPSEQGREPIINLTQMCHEFEIFQTGPVPRGTTQACIISFMHTIHKCLEHTSKLIKGF